MKRHSGTTKAEEQETKQCPVSQYLVTQAQGIEKPIVLGMRLLEEPRAINTSSKLSLFFLSAYLIAIRV